MQIRFIDERYRRAFLYLAIRPRLERELAALMMRNHTSLSQGDLFQTAWEFSIHTENCIPEKPTDYSFDGSFICRIFSDKRFEGFDRAPDNSLNSDLPWRSHIQFNRRLAIEIKPLVGDDYPEVLRQCHSNGANYLFFRDFEAEGVSFNEFSAFFAEGGVKVVSEREVNKVLAGEFDGLSSADASIFRS